MKRRVFAYAFAACLAFGLPSNAQTWPAKPIKIVVPYQAGQGTDVGARLFAEQLHVPLLLSFPSGTGRLARSSLLTTQADLSATLIDAVGARPCIALASARKRRRISVLCSHTI